MPLNWTNCLLFFSNTRRYAKDTRYSDENVASHDRQLMKSVPATSLMTVMDMVDNYDVIAVDEGQFFPDCTYSLRFDV